ncbi:MAG: serine/threonine protein kinase [Wenzhouxiangella sp.]|nr:serine/threonine protein kinase [Wenzhouxiangella sp.]
MDCMIADLPRLSPLKRRALDRLLIQYLELEPAGQARFLARCRQRLPRLAAGLAALIGSVHTVTLLDQGPGARFSSQLADHYAESEQVLDPGTCLGPWQVTERIGEGGMGAVYRGQRADGAFEMDVAIKLIRRRREGLAEQLQRESRLLARLQHPAITRLMDAGLDDEAGPFLVMEWIEGDDLQQWLDARKPALDDRLAVFVDLLAAVHHAHQRLIVHGDIKPDNIRIEPSGAVRLMDFGVSRLLADEHQRDRALIALTPAYAAPEQLDGDTISTRSDIWSLGALLFALLTGSRLPKDAASLDAKIAENIAATGASRAHELAAIIVFATATDPEQRYRSVADLADDIGRYQRNEPLLALPVSRPQRLVKFCHRHSGLVGAAAVVTLMVLSSLGVISVLWIQASADRERAEQAAATAQTVTELQQGLLADMAPDDIAEGLLLGLRQAAGSGAQPEADLIVLNRLIDQAGPVDVLRTRLVESVLQPAEQRMDLELADSPVSHAALRHSLAEVYLRWGIHDQAAAHFQQAWREREVLLGAEHPDTLASGRRLSVALREGGDPHEARALGESLLATAREGLGLNHRETLKQADSLANTLIDLGGEREQAYALLTEALEGWRALADENHPRALSTRHNLAVGLFGTERSEEAFDMFERVLEARLNVLGERHPHTLASMNALAIARYMTGHADGAVELMQRSIDVSVAVHGRDHPSTLLYQWNLASLHLQEGDIDRALPLTREVYQRRLAVLGQAHADTQYAAQTLAMALVRAGRLDEALALTRSAFAVLEDVLGPDNYRTLAVAGRHAVNLVRAGFDDEARELIDEVLETTLQVEARKSVQTLDVLRQYFDVLRIQQDYEAAARALTDFRDLLEAELPPAFRYHQALVVATVVRLYGDWHQTEPGQGHDQAAEYWQQRQDELRG